MPQRAGGSCTTGPGTGTFGRRFLPELQGMEQDTRVSLKMNGRSTNRVTMGLMVIVYAGLLAGTPVSGQDCCTPQRIVYYKTVYEQQPVTAYRLQYETVLQEQPVTVMRPAWVTETRERRYTVAKPVTETSTREERYTVMRPVWETETRYQQQVVRKAVVETAMQDRNYVTYEPVTTMHTQYVDQGGFVDQVFYTPGPVRNRLQWVPGSYCVDPVTGSAVWQRGGLHWVPTQAPGAYQVQRQYVPQIVAQQVPQTTYVQRVVTQKVPIQVTRYVDEVVSQPVPMQVCKWVAQEVVRPVTVTTQRIEYEERVEPVQVQTCRWVAETRSVQTPHVVAKWVPYTTTRLVPRTVAMSVPADPCGLPSGITSYYAPAADGCPAPPPVAADTRRAPTEAERPAPETTEERSTLKPPGDAGPPARGGTPAEKKPESNPSPAKQTGSTDSGGLVAVRENVR